MQFAYQFPERTDRLILVSAGGVGREVNPVLRAVSLPGADLVLSTLRLPGMRGQVGLFTRLIKLLDTDLGQDAAELLHLVDALPDATSRSAFISTLRAVVDWRGQVVTMLDRCYLTAGHAHAAAVGIAGQRGPRPARLRRPRGDARQPPGDLRGRGPLPFHSDPARFRALVEDFVRTTAPADWSQERWRELLRSGREIEDILQLASERSAT